MLSAPAVIAALLVATKMLSVVIAGNSAGSDFAAGDASALRTDASMLRIVNVIEPAKAPFAAGTLAVLEGRLDEADARFVEALARADPSLSCTARVNLELVRERQGDLAAWEAQPDRAREYYRGALAVIDGAPPGCFAGNTDPQTDRRAVRNDAGPRVTAKLANLGTTPPSAPPPPPPPRAAPMPAPGGSTPQPDEPSGPLRLHPDSGDPVDRLRQLLEDAAG